jgi:hypothetical protein
MKIPVQVLKAVVFVCYEDKTKHEIVPVGTGFFLGHDPKDNGTTSPRVWVVTALHVIQELKKLGVQEVILRLNPRDQAKSVIAIPSKTDAWYSHPTDGTIDAALLECGVPKEADHLVIPLSFCATDQTFKDNEVNLGDEVFISGFFTHHFGNKRNLPIVRVGNLAALNDEKISTDGFGDIDGYLVEARSTGGLSGSPVFLNLGIVRSIGGTIKHHNGPDGAIFLLGLVHGHFLANPTSKKIGAEDINAGIAIAVSIGSIRKVVDEYDKAHPRK